MGRRLATVAFCLACGLVGDCLAAQAAERPWRILVLNNGDPGLPAFVAIDRAMRTVLTEPGRHSVEVFIESLDIFRFPGAQHEKEFVALLARKYASPPLDAVVLYGNAGFDFSEKYGDQLWREARILFMGVTPESLRGRNLGPNITGMPRHLDLSGNAELALRLRPSTRRLVVISGSGDFDRNMARLARTQLARYERQVTIEYWQDAPIGEFARRISLLGNEDAVLYLTIGRDADGRIFNPADALKLLAAASPVPIYGTFETYLGKGMAAGMVEDYATRGRRMGELVHQTLSLRPAPAPPLIAENPPVCVADAGMLDRMGLGLGALPAGCDVRFRPPSLWREYRGQAIAALAVMILQAGLIAGLLWQRRARRKAEAEARQRRAELGQASRLALAGELTASIAHEINQPLGAILANTGAAEALLKRDPVASDELREILADIRKADLRASEVVRRVRALVTTRQAEHEKIDVNDAIRDVLAFLRGEARRRGIEAEADLAPGLPVLMADRVQLQQALVNLCVNAMEAMADCEPGKKRLGLRTWSVPDGIEIAVRDSGPGIPEQHLPLLFDSFFTTKAHGTGLGLSITRSIIEAHEGRISAENRAGGGAMFLIVLPARATAAA